jgi:hypothetical protein
MDNSDKMNQEPEFITIVEGPEPEFQDHNDIWVLSVLEGADYIGLERCRLRTFNGNALVKRCQDAWSEGRPVILDFPNRLGLRRQVEIAAARAETVDEGDLLHLWVRSQDEPEKD